MDANCNVIPRARKSRKRADEEKKQRAEAVEEKQVADEQKQVSHEQKQRREEAVEEKRLAHEEKREAKAKDIVRRFVDKTRKNVQKKKSDERKKKLKAAEVIQRFIAKTKHIRRAEFLKAVCSDSGVCLAFGTERAKIKKHFNGFVNFDYVKSITPIGAVSVNGFIRDIRYVHGQYVANAILKSSANEIADNLLYEYIVGKALNEYIDHYPCFVETYGCFNYESETDWTNMKFNPTVDILKNKLKLVSQGDIDLNNFAKEACAKPTNISILIQHFKGVKSVQDMVSNKSFRDHELLNVLLQVYIPLSILQDKFTHYDLHGNNVLLYEPVKDGYIHYHYHLSPNTIDFKSKYIAKIIDYGRSYFNKSAAVNSKKIYDNVCKESECKTTCGDEKGFEWFNNRYLDESYWISSQQRNKSHDLRLLNILKEDGNIGYNTTRANVLNIVQYAHNYGTPELNNSGLPFSINNVEDAKTQIIECMLKIKGSIGYLDVYSDASKKIGDLHIYLDKPMRFVKA